MKRWMILRNILQRGNDCFLVIAQSVIGNYRDLSEI